MKINIVTIYMHGSRDLDILLSFIWQLS